jgi:eukaryotic-like serine/threonine-protein kinase
VLEVALEPEPNRRYASAEEFARALDDYLNNSGGPVSENDVAAWLEELFGRDAAMTNPSVVTMQPLGSGPLGTDVLPAMPLSPNTLPEMSAVVLPTAIVPALQGETRSDEPVPKPPRVSAPVAMVQKVGWPVVITAAVIAFVALGLGVYAVRLATPDPVAPLVEPPPVLAGTAPDAGPAQVELPPVLPVEEPDAGLAIEPVVEVPPEPPPKPVKPPRVRKPKPQPGKVTVRVNPWAEVFYNGKSYGVTPLKNAITAPAGTAVFTLKNSQLGVSRKYTVKVPAGGEVLLKADLFKK